MKRDLVLMQKSTQSQIAKLNDTSTAMLEENQQRFQALKNQLQEATAASLRQSRSEGKRKTSEQPNHSFRLEAHLISSQ